MQFDTRAPGEAVQLHNTAAYRGAVAELVFIRRGDTVELRRNGKAISATVVDTPRPGVLVVRMTEGRRRRAAELSITELNIFGCRKQDPNSPNPPVVDPA